MRNLFATLLAGALVATALPASAGSAPRADVYASALNADVEASKAAMTAAREKVEAGLEYPEEAGAYFADRPLHFVHPVESVEQVQPDGTAFGARVLEISEGGGAATMDDHLITRGEDGWWRYGTRQANGKIAATDAIVGQDAPPAGTRIGQGPAAFKQNLSTYAKYENQLNRYLQARNSGISREVIAANEQVVFKIPALLFKVNNEDFQPESTSQKYEDLYSGIGTSETGTTTEMYLEQSFGNMLIQLDVYGPYTESISNNEANDCWYGTEGGPILGEELGLGGYGAKGMAWEAVPQSDGDVDYAQYDQDGNNYVDFLMIIHSGRGAETSGDPCDVWSHYFSGLGPAFGAPPEPALTADGVLIGPVLTVPEIDAQIGVVTHEIMHALGEPDYYGTAGTSGTGDWDLGAGGSYGGIPTQTNPLHFNPVMKVNFGWIDPTVIDTTTLGAELDPRAMYPDLLQVPTRIEAAGTDRADECDKAPISLVPSQNNAFYDADGNCLAAGFLIENYQRTAAFSDRESCTFTPADFDRQGYQSGLMIWHWDFTNYESLGNNNVLRPMLDIEEFDRRFGTQDLEQAISRADPFDPFWGDPVGISSATGAVATDDAIPPSPEGSPYTVSAPVPGISAGTTPDWVVPETIATGVIMVVELHWQTENVDDYDLGIEELLEDGTYAEVATSGGLPGNGGESTAFAPKPGGTYRAVAKNYASASLTAEVTVTYDGGGVVKFGPSNTLNALAEPTGWQFTNIQPYDYRGLAHGGERADTPMTLDLIKHDDTTVDVSGDFLEVVPSGAFAEPVIAGSPVTLRSQVYNHGGKAVSGATFTVYDADPATGASPIATFTKDLAAFSKDTVEFAYTPKAGLNELYVKAAAADDLVAGNNIVRTELTANAVNGAKVLLVDNDRGWTTNQTVAANLNALGVPFHRVEGPPSRDTMAGYDAVIVITSTVSGAKGVWSAAAWDEMVGYLDPAGDLSVAGGKVWVASNRLGAYAVSADIQRADQLGAYFGLTPINNILDPMGTITGTGAAIGGDRAIPVGYVDGRPYLDYFDASDATLGTTTMLFTHDAREGSFLGSLTEADTFTTVFTPSLTLVTHGADQLELTREALTELGIATGSPAAEVKVAFNRFQHVQRGQEWVVPIGATGVEGVEFVYKIFGDDSWSTIVGTQVAPGMFEVTIPASDVTNNGLEYYVQTVTGGVKTPVDGGAAMPNVASGTFGDPADVDFGVCAAGGGVAPVAEPTPAPLPSTGGGLALLGLLAVGGAMGLRRRSLTN